MSSAAEQACAALPLRLVFPDWHPRYPDASTLPMWTHRLSLATALAAWMFVLATGLAHGSGAAACAGSPCDGSLGALQAQHLAAWGVGLLTAALCLMSLLEGRRIHATVPRLAALALLLVVARRLLGELMALEVSPGLLSWAHLCVSVIFFAPVMGIACLTRHAARPDSPARRDAVPAGSYWLLVLATGLCFVQIVLGGLVRHAGAGLACGDLPLCRGVLPLGQSAEVILHAVHRLHGLLFAAVTFVALPRLRPHLRRQTDSTRRLLLVLLSFGVLAQIVLGLLTVWSYLGLLVVSLHLGLGALLLAGLLVLCFRLRAASAASEAADLGGLISPQGDAA